MMELQQMVNQAKREILAMVQGDAVGIWEGLRIPNTVTSFDQLHEYCDANMLGGACDELEQEMENQAEYERVGMSAALVAKINAMQTEIDNWLRLRNF